MRLEWDDKYSTGESTVDGHHKYLFQAINEFGDSIEMNQGVDDIKDILNLLTSYTQMHFKFEEHCMNRLHCPVADKNQSEHAKFLNAIEKFQRDMRFKEPDKEMLYKVHNAAVNWPKNHIMRIDTHLKACPSTPGLIESDKGVTGLQ